MSGALVSAVQQELKKPKCYKNPKLYNFNCECGKNFSFKKHFNAHRRKFHNEPKVVANNLQKHCPLCFFSARFRDEIIKHFEVVHNIQFIEEKHTFETQEEFLLWKNRIESETLSKFINNGTKTFSKHKITNFNCHRSGCYIPRGKGLRALKLQGSNKINSFCPARVVQKHLNESTCIVYFSGTHVGHQNELKYLTLTATEREELAKKIALRIPFDDILDQIRDSTYDGPLKRMHLLTRQDLYNIETAYNLHSKAVRHKDDAVSVDSWVEEMEGEDVFQENDSLPLLNEKSGELSAIDFTKMDINDLCRGCLGLQNTNDMHNLNFAETKINTLYEELTKTKMSTTNVSARMCPDCVLLLLKTDQFINMLRHSYKVLEKAAEEIKSLENLKNKEPNIYNDKKTSILQDVLKEKYSVTDSKKASDLQIEIPNEEIKLSNDCSDIDEFDNLSVHNDSSTSDDEIPLAERFKIDVEKAVIALKNSNPMKPNKARKSRSKKTKEYHENVPENESSVNAKSKNEATYISKSDACPMCLKKVRYLTKHLETVHSVDWIKAKCLKCLHTNIDTEKLVEHCKTCCKTEVVPDYSNCDDVKEEYNDETSDRDCDLYFDVENRDREYLKDIEYDTKEDIEAKKRERPTTNGNRKQKFECNRCEEAYKTYEDIEVHFKLAHRSEPSCIICDQEYNNSFSLLYHMMVKHGKLKCCRLCLVSFKNSDELNSHYKSEEHNTKCTVCGEQFKNRKALYEHRRKKHLNPQLENQKYKCPECPKEFANQNNIRRHILVAHNDLRFLCDTCGQSYTTKRNLKLHIQKFHEGLQVETKNNKKNFFCEACGRELKIFHKYAIAMHRAKHKGHNYVCKKCYETFETEEMFKKHVEAFGHQLYECHKCQSQFVREENYKIHLKNHDAPGWNKNMFATWGKSAKLRNEKGEFVCSYCPKVFKDKQRLDNHVRVHTNERPYKCHICGKGFKTWIHRKTHLNIHLGIKKWVCKFCSKAFTNSCTLKGHEMIHTGERPHRCPECKKGFITMSAMKKHRMVHFRTGGSNYGKKANRNPKDEDKTESDNEENAEFVYKYGQMFTGSDVSYESFVEPPKAEPVGLVSIEKELSC